MNDHFLVSVIMPTYNRPHFLQRAVKSVLAQTYTDWELLIIDDASTDDTSIFAKSFSDSRIRYVRLEKNQGMSHARNIGLKLAQGQYIGFLDDDDEIDPEKIEKQIQKFETSNSSVYIIYCGCRMVYHNQIIGRSLPRLRGNIYENILAGYSILIHVPLVKKECFQRVGYFDETLGLSEDWDMWIRMSKCYEFEFVPETLTTYHLHGQQMCSNLKDRIKVRRLFLQRYQKELSQFPKAHSIHLGRLGILCYLEGQLKEGLKLIYQATILYPLNWKNYAYFVLLLCDKIKKGILERFVIEKIGDLRLYY